jgi:ABC-2 type transport system ATP-binding protein
VNDPELVFLDELTTGLDPHARHSMWDLLLDIRKNGKTIILSTHFMEEAERLCDRVAIIDRGHIVALDSPKNLVRGLGGDSRLSFDVDGVCDVGLLNGLSSVTRVEAKGERLTVFGSGSEMAAEVTGALATNGVRFRDLKTEQATLEDVFLSLTGREMRD